ncbi:S-layer homology domain-containing protein [Paenibacillus agaridevorans]|uniref:S-layer homology domain-containing protein n=1 Tax=Paenibacillus agaridevorans TaxID=171404 RepID=UPI001BE42A47|nr:S-layer homology domain-containing protein [Paenibacillus agaridevorans]
MKSKAALLLAILLALQVVLETVYRNDREVSADSPTPGAELYVSLTGDDGNDGTLTHPLATLEGARDRIRQLKTGAGLPEGGVAVYVREGEYRLTSTFELLEEDSGTASKPIVYSAYPGEEVRISGGLQLDGTAFSPVSDPATLARIPEEGRAHVLQIDLDAEGITDLGQYRRHGYLHDVVSAPLELFVNEQAMHLARWPNEGYLPLGQVLDTGSIPRQNDNSNRGGKFKYDYDRADRWTGATQLMLHGYFGYGFAEDNIRVEEIDTTARTIKLADAHLYGLSTANAAWKTYYAYNLLEEIDEPGEYFLDYDSSTLYLYPTVSLSGARIQASMLEEPLAAIEDASFIKIQGFIFENSRDMGIYMEGGDGNTIAGNTFRNLGTVAISVGQGVRGPGYTVHEFTGVPESRVVGNIQGHIYLNQDWDRLGGVNHVIAGNEVTGTGAGGIYVGAGNRETLTPGNVQVRNNKISDFNRRDEGYRPGIWLTGAGNVAANNEIYNSPHMAIYLNGNDHVIEKNEIHHVLREADDMGSIYMGRNASEQGNVIRYNFFHHLGSDHASQAVFLDDGASGQLIHGNVFYKAGSNANMHIHGGHHNVFRNNISIDIPHVIQATLWTQTRWVEFLNEPIQRNRLLGSINIKQEPYASKYPILSGYYDGNNVPVQLPLDSNIMEDNVVVGGALYRNGPMTVAGNWITNADPGFVDADAMNFELMPNSEVYTQIPGFEPIPFASIGLYDDEYRDWNASLGTFDVSAPANAGQDVDPLNVEFRWEPSAGAVQYRLLVATDNQFAEIVSDTVTGRTRHVLEGAITYDETYYWKVIAYSASYSRPAELANANGVMTFDSRVTDRVPDAPNLAFTRLDHVQLAWNRVDMATEYHVYRGSHPDAAFERIAVLANELSYVDTDVSALHDYYYYVEAVNRLGSGEPSPIVASYGGTAVLFEDLFEDELQPGWVQESSASPGTWQLTDDEDGKLLHFNGTFGNQKRALGRTHYSIESRLRVNNWLGSNASAQMVFLIGNDSNPVGAGTRYQLMYRNTGKLQLEKRAAGGMVQETDFTLVPGEWYTFRLSVSPGYVRGYVNDELLIEYEDANPLAAGSAGLQIWNADVDVDDYRISIPKWDSLASPWELRNYGAQPNYASYERGEYTLRAVGADVWGTSDEFGYISQWVQNADAEKITMEATLESLTNTDSNTMAGIMFRSRDAQDAANFYLRMKPNGEVFTTVRMSNGGLTTYKNISPVPMPTKLKVTREKKLFTSYYMSNGEWVQMQQLILDMPEEMLAGLAVSSRTSEAYAEAVFSDVSLSRSELELKAPLVGDVTPRDGAVSLSWTGHEGVTGYVIRYGTVPGNPDAQTELPAGQTYHTLTGLTNDTTYYISIAAKYGSAERETEVFTAVPDGNAVVRSAYTSIAATGFDEMSGVTVVAASDSIGSLDNNDWVQYNNVEFNRGATAFIADVAVAEAQAGKDIEVRLHAADGPLLGKLTVASTGAFTNFVVQQTAITGNVQGIHNVYLVFKGGFGVANLKKFQFAPEEEEAGEGETGGNGGNGGEGTGGNGDGGTGGTGNGGNGGEEPDGERTYESLLHDGRSVIRIHAEPLVRELRNGQSGPVELRFADGQSVSRHRIEVPAAIREEVRESGRELQFEGKGFRILLTAEQLGQALAEGDLVIEWETAPALFGRSGFSGVADAAKLTVRTAKTGQAVGLSAKVFLDLDDDLQASGKRIALFAFDEIAKEWRYAEGGLELGGGEASYTAHSGVEASVFLFERDYADVTNKHWAYEYIAELGLRDYMRGTANERFEPERTITRAEFAALLARMLGLPKSNETGAFSDVEADAWYAGEITALHAAGIMNGYDGAVHPQEVVTREQMAVMLDRARRYAGMTFGSATAGTAYADSGQISEWALEAVRQLTETGIMQGTGNERFQPLRAVTRAQAAAALARMLTIGQ